MKVVDTEIGLDIEHGIGHWELANSTLGYCLQQKWVAGEGGGQSKV